VYRKINEVDNIVGSI